MRKDTRAKRIRQALARPPSYFTNLEGVVWKPWPHKDLLTDHQLAIHMRDIAERDPSIQGTIVHSLAWGNVMEGEKFARWDCISGWTNLPKEINW